MVAVKVTPVPAVGKTIPVTVTELVPERIVPLVVPVIAPAFPLVVKLNAELEEIVVTAPYLSKAVTFAEKAVPAVGEVGVMVSTLYP